MKRIQIIFLLMVLTFGGLTAQQMKTEKIILITLDGLRWQELFTGADEWLITNRNYVEDTTALKDNFWADTPDERREMLMPFFWSTLASEGSLFGNRNLGSEVDLTNQMWFSYPGYNEILTGKADDENIHSNEKIPNPNTTVLEILNKTPKYEGKIAAFGSWDVFPYIINEERSGVPVNAGFEPAAEKNLTELEKSLNLLQPLVPSPWGSVRLDAFTHYYAFEYLKKYKPDVLYIAYGETDDFAHDKKYDAYLTSAHRTDEFIREIWNWAQNDPDYEGKTTLIISTDHGRGLQDEWTSHGIKIENANQTWFAAIGPDFKSLGEAKSQAKCFNNQYAATIAKLLGAKMPENAGKPLDVLLK